MENKKKTIEEVLERLKAGTEAVFESENYKELLKVTAKLYHYSLNNCILIAISARELPMWQGIRCGSASLNAT